MYLSGPPLHVLAMNLVRRFREALRRPLPHLLLGRASTAHNFADAVALGLVPVTVCSDLLQARRLRAAARLLPASWRARMDDGAAIDARVDEFGSGRA